MNLKQAQYVKTIAECGSITAAAKKLFVSQPSLSQMLRQLEQETGLPIFDRSTTPLRLPSPRKSPRTVSPAYLPQKLSTLPVCRPAPPSSPTPK